MDNQNTATLYDLFAHQASKHPHQPAVRHNTNTYTYAEVQQFANAIATHLNPFSDRGQHIAISTTRTAYQALGIVATFQLGASYIPLDPTFPVDRLQQIIEDSGVVYVLCLQEERAFFEQLGLKICPFETITQTSTDRLLPAVSPSQGGYVLYTSGSTGKPKGVQMGNDALVNLLQWQEKDSIAGVGTHTLQFAPLTFDVSFQEFFATFSTGGTLYMIDDDLRLNPIALLQFIEEHQINRLFLPFVALQLLTDTAEFAQRYPKCLQEIMTAGEQLKITPQVVRFFQELKDAVLFNQYGPTESHVVTSLKLEGDPTQWPALPSIGKAIWNTEMLILNEQLQEVPTGETGELYISGVCLADGYLNRPDLTSERFFSIDLPGRGPTRVYKSGDLAHYLPDGNIEFLGRIDHQVKIRGHRVELGEIETQLIKQESVRDAVVFAVGEQSDQRRLVAYLLMADGVEQLDPIALQRALKKNLPEYMIPAAFVRMESFPKTTSGKVDRKALPIPVSTRPDFDIPYRAASTPTQMMIVGVWKELLQMDKIGIDDNFFELGGNSLLAQKTIVQLQQKFGIALPITKLYQYPTIAGIVQYLEQGTEKTNFRTIRKDLDDQVDDPIAIIGMAGRFPGAHSVEKLWEVLKNGQETIRFFAKEELDPTIPTEEVNDPNYVAARGIIDDVGGFDEQLFGLTPLVAKLMDPQQRVFLEICREVLEQTGHLPGNYEGHVGIFGGAGQNTYYLQNVLTNPDEIAKIGSFNAVTLNEKDYISSRVSYQLNLKGPAVSVFSACSTSSLAIAQAVSSLRAGHCDVAIAGGVSVKSPVNSGQRYEEGAMFSVDGHCRPFDKEATGTVFSDGAAVVALKKLSQALLDGDEIYALVKGIGINNDGGDKGSFTAPSAHGQAEAIAMAISDAGVDPAEITYIETHGTATPLGDPIEFEGLKLAFGPQEKNQYCRIGSIKSNMGHLTHAAGAASIIKTALSLKHGVIPPSLHYKEANPNIDFESSPFRVNHELTPWNETKRIAGVSSFGVGGTNVHIILEGYQQPEETALPNRDHTQLIAWSAKSKAATEAYGDALLQYIDAHPHISLSALGYTLRTARPDFSFRTIVSANSISDLKQKLQQKTTSTQNLKAHSQPMVFMFPGQGAQYVRMGYSIYQKEPVFKSAVDRCSEILKTHLGEDLREVIYADPNQEGSADTLRNTKYTQPALFVTQYALAQLWMHWGLQPSAFIGHSVGEFVAAHLAGVFSLEDALKLVATRGRLISELPGGSMLSVRHSADWVQQHLPENLSIAAINAPELCVVAGPQDAIQHFMQYCEEQDVRTSLLHTSHAFHSAMMDPILPAFEEVVASCQLHVPQKPIASTVTGEWLKDQEATDPGYWVKHVKATVRFSTAFAFCHEALDALYLEVGPGTVTATLARQHKSVDRSHVISGLQAQASDGDEWASLSDAAGKLWQRGISLNWDHYYGLNRSQFLRDLPPYAYQKNNHWLQPGLIQTSGAIQTVSNPINNLPVNTQPTEMRKDILIRKIKEILDEASGIQIDDQDVSANFIEIGLDSLLLTQIAQTLKKEFGLPITFRKLNEEYYSLDLLATYLDQALPADQYQPAAPAPTQAAAPMANAQVQHAVQAMPAPLAMGLPSLPIQGGANQDTITLISQQISLISQQIALLNGLPTTYTAGTAAPSQPHVSSTPAVNSPVAHKAVPSPQLKLSDELSKEELTELKKPFGATARIEKQSTTLTPAQKDYIKNFIETYVAKTKKSKDYTQEHRAYMADPRVVSGFKPATKEMTYALVVNRSAGCRLWDIDGNEYIDALNGFGSSMLGNQPEVVKKALLQQIEEGYEIGPQHEKAGEVCKLVKELTGQDRVGLCNTGSEAVLGAMRIARTVTGRSLIVAFSNSYHGIVDEVIVRGTKKLKTFPAASGIMPEAVQNMLILDYGTEESLAIIRERADELAAVLVEPIQSRRPEFAPVEFLKEVREITKKSGTALIFDEVISGFRFHPAGAQGLFGIKADIGTYGKVAGAGISIGIIAGQKSFMDALDGGYWQYGDESVPEAGVTYFAGTFVRHPLALATTLASLQYMKEQGPSLQINLNNQVTYLAEKMNAVAQKYQTPIYIAHFGSLWKIKYKEEFQFSDLIFAAMRLRGIHILDGFPCFLTTAHTQADIDAIIQAFEESVAELKEVGFIPVYGDAPTQESTSQLNPPVAGARLGKDAAGNPAWFVEDPSQPGQYMQVESK